MRFKAFSLLRGLINITYSNSIIYNDLMILSIWSGQYYYICITETCFNKYYAYGLCCMLLLKVIHLRYY